MKIIKKYLINILFLVLAIYAFLSAFQNGWYSDIIFWVIEGILIGLTFTYIEGSKEKGEFPFFNKFKVMLIFLLLLLSTLSGLGLLDHPAPFFKFRYGVCFLLSLMTLISILIVNFIIRIDYRIWFNQKFNFKSIYKEHLLVKLLFLGLFMTNIYLIVKLIF